MPVDPTIEPVTESSSSSSHTEGTPGPGTQWALLKQLRKDHDRLEARVWRLAVAAGISGTGVGVAGTAVAQALLGGP
jgi:hypothetical protein